MALPLLAVHGGVSAQDRMALPSVSAGPSSEGIRIVEPGAAAPDFTVRDTEGGAFRFAEENAKRPVLLLFWSIFCEPCRLDLPLLQKIHARHKDAGLAVVAVDLDGEPLRHSVAGFIRQEGYTFRVLIDELEARETFKAADPFGVAWIPTIILVERGGKVTFSRSGRIREEDLERAVQLLLKK